MDIENWDSKELLSDNLDWVNANRHKKFQENSSKMILMIKEKCLKVGFTPEKSVECFLKEIAEDANGGGHGGDDDDVLVVGDNLDLFANKIIKDSKVFVKSDKWVAGVVLEVNLIELKNSFKVIPDGDLSLPVVALSNEIAFFESPTNAKMDVGTRVVAYNLYKAILLSGVISEHPREKNNQRYLIFFDDGSVHYSHKSELRLVYEPKDPVWEDIENARTKEFVRSYMDLFPHIPIVQVQPGTRLRILKHNSWLLAEVKEIDASMMRVVYSTLSSSSSSLVSEWVYRGSRRLEPLNHQFNAYKKKSRTARFSTGSSNRAYVVYTIIKDDDDVPMEVIDLDPEESAARKTKNTARRGQLNKVGKAVKSSAVSDSANGSKEENNDSFDALAGHLVSTSEHLDISPIANRMRKRPGKHHICTELCLKKNIEDNGHVINSLLTPMKHGWERNIKNQDKLRKRYVIYTSYCGLSVRKMKEVDACLLSSNSPLTIEQFSFDQNLDVLMEYVLNLKHMDIPDYSLGREKVPVQCVNSIDTDTPPYLEYTTVRVPGVDVHIDTQPMFLAGCSCTDGCRDRSKCECVRLTVNETDRIPNEKNAKAGYHNRRLKKAIPTGIYECNSNCSCDHRCHNRVVQNGLTLKLQIFKTDKKGWGLRCLNDVPAGQFICHYTGQVLTDEIAEGERALADEYLADLDYIEAVEKMKEGFECEVNDPEAFEDKSELCNNVSAAVHTGSSKKGSVVSVGKDGEGVGAKSLKKQTARKTTGRNRNSVDLVRRLSTRQMFGYDGMFIIDTKSVGNLGRYINHSCAPNMFVQNVFVDSHDLRFPWVAFFAFKLIKAGSEMTWDYGYEVDMVPGKELICHCGASNCSGRLL